MKKPLNIILGFFVLVFLVNGIIDASHTGPTVSFSDTSQGEGQLFIILAIILGAILLVRVSNSDWAKTTQGKNDWKNTADVTPVVNKRNRHGAKK